MTDSDRAAADYDAAIEHGLQLLSPADREPAKAAADRLLMSDTTFAAHVLKFCADFGPDSVAGILAHELSKASR